MSASRAYAAALVGAHSALARLGAMVQYPPESTTVWLQEVAGVAERLRAKLAEAERLEKVSVMSASDAAPDRIFLYVNGTRRELLPTDRVTHIARIARAAFKVTGQPARLHASGWHRPQPENAP